MANKKILVISPQIWGKMFVAKHHYAVELARLGNEVYFLNPPIYKKRNYVKVEEAPGYDGLKIIHHGPLFPMLLRFRLRKTYERLMKMHVKWLMKKLGQSFDVVWCFEPNLYSNLDWFNAKKKVFHPVDELLFDFQYEPGSNADLVISVTHEILSKFHAVSGQKLFVNHGISREFENAVGDFTWKKKEPVTIGYSGNLLRPDIDFETIRQCVQEFPNAQFIFWGNYKMKGSNLAGNLSEEISNFIQFLEQSPNVVLKGAVNMHELVKEYQQADVFIICYDIKKDQSRGTNYHKVMEFLSTGKVVVSNNITTYKNCDLLRMCSSRDSNVEFAALLKETIDHLEVYNSKELQEKRKRFACHNSYKTHVVKIVEQLFN
jgi:hypothetical protein